MRRSVVGVVAALLTFAACKVPPAVPPACALIAQNAVAVPPRFCPSVAAAGEH